MQISQLIHWPGSTSVSWVLETLVRLDVRITGPTNDHADPWQKEGSLERLTREGLRALHPVIPGLRGEDRFLFSDSVAVRCDHQLSAAQHHQLPTVVLVEDPRRSLFRLWYRQGWSSRSAEEFLSRPLDDANGDFGGFGLPPIDAWSLWHLFWMSVSKVTKVRIMRVETLLADPSHQIEALLEALGIHRSAAEIQVALARTEAARSDATKPIRPEAEAFEALLCEWFVNPAASIAEAFGYRWRESLPWSQGTLLDACYDTEICQRMDHAAIAYQAGDLASARSALAGGLGQASTQPSAALYLGSVLQALEWTVQIFGNALAASPAGQAVFESFFQFLERGIALPSLQRHLRKTLRAATEDSFHQITAKATRPLHAPAAPPATAPVELNYRGYDIFTFQTQFCAVARDLGSVSLETLSPERIAELEREGLFLRDQFTMDLKEKIDQMVARRQAAAA